MGQSAPNLAISLADLIGAWRLSRVIEDQRAGITGRFEGECHWREEGSNIWQEENGLLHYGTAPPMRATRRYLWQQQGAALALFFEDGRPFHTLSTDQTRDAHWCDPDMYHVSYDFSQWPEWQSVWKVTGPRKDALITSRFTR